MVNSTYIQQIKEKLSELNPHKVILFGSHAYGTPYSDIDLLVVTNDEFMPQSYKERQKLYLKVGNHILDILQQVPVDLLVYKLPMYRQFVESGSSFSREVLTQGKILYESEHAGMA